MPAAPPVPSLRRLPAIAATAALVCGLVRHLPQDAVASSFVAGRLPGLMTSRMARRVNPRAHAGNMNKFEKMSVDELTGLVGDLQRVLQRKRDQEVPDKLDAILEEVKTQRYALENIQSATASVEDMAAWDLSGIDLSSLSKDEYKESPKFALRGVSGLFMKLYPQGDEDAAEGRASLRLCGAPKGTMLKCKLWLDEKEASSTKWWTFQGSECWGFSNMAPASQHFKEARVNILAVAHNGDGITTWTS
mmetsp:Transcript_106891/g.212265  ORF Transcript_106891/g.212265 Transcript_106891/m.212265 type:complete len:248 (+) Transcript_106891:75-818(+)